MRSSAARNRGRQSAKVVKQVAKVHGVKRSTARKAAKAAKKGWG
jgi:hypothetical protein